MARQNLEQLQLQQHLDTARELVGAESRPKKQKARPSSAKHRVGTLATPYERADGTRTIKVNVNLSVELVGRLKSHTAVAEMHGVSRAEWIEAALSHCIASGFLPKPDASED
ncbi:MAG: hypothetical protein RLZZ450_3092 [Pseudomonadota bacterium]|jgi:hypothetical protein